MLRSSDTEGPLHSAFYYFDLDRIMAVRSGPWKLSQDGRLYHLPTDPEEQQDLAASIPRVADHMQTLLNHGRAELGDRHTGSPGRNRRPTGTYEPAAAS